MLGYNKNVPSIRYQQLRLVIYPNDHPPPHTHIIGPGWEMRVRLTKPPSLISIYGDPKQNEISKALRATNENLNTLNQYWSNLYE